MKTTVTILLLLGLVAYSSGFFFNRNNIDGTRCWRTIFSNRLYCRDCPIGCVRYLCSGADTPYTCSASVTGAAAGACQNSSLLTTAGTPCTRRNSNDCNNSFTGFWSDAKSCTADLCPATPTADNPVCDTTN